MRRRHTSRALNGQREAVRDVVRHVHAVQSTIQREIGVAVVKIGFATGGHSEHTRRQYVVLFLTLYVLTTAQSTTQLTLLVLVITVFHKI